MTHSIEIDDEIYEYLLKQVRNFGETASDVLRRELGFQAQPIIDAGDNHRSSHELEDILERPDIQRARGVVGKFLAILASVHEERKESFESILAIQGRDRKYFAKSRQEIEKSGNSTQPKQIPRSSYWVMTNTPTKQKVEMLRAALEVLGYSQSAITAAVKKLSS